LTARTAAFLRAFLTVLRAGATIARTHFVVATFRTRSALSGVGRFSEPKQAGKKGDDGVLLRCGRGGVLTAGAVVMPPAVLVASAVARSAMVARSVISVHRVFFVMRRPNRMRRGRRLRAGSRLPEVPGPAFLSIEKRRGTMFGSLGPHLKPASCRRCEPT
jgi:hypothetical protein